VSSALLDILADFEADPDTPKAPTALKARSN
jgi:hypothetical protein